MIRSKIELIRDLMVVFVICKNDEDPIKMKALEWLQHYSCSKCVIRYHENQSFYPICIKYQPFHQPNDGSDIF